MELASTGEREDITVAEAAAERLGQYIADSQLNQNSRVLRDKQMDVMQDLQQFLGTESERHHGYISLPTGVGKTVLFTELVKATGLRTIVLTPTQLLLGQTEDAFNRFSEDDIAVGKVYSGEKNGSEDITLTTYASFVRHTKRGDSPHIRPGHYPLIILDEAHRALATETQRALEQYKDAIIVGFTATEEYSTSKNLKNLLPNEIHKMTIKEAVEHSLITPFTNLIVETGVDVSNVKITATNEYDAADLERALNTETRNKIALDLYKKYFDGMKAIVFCNGVSHASSVAELFAEAGVNALAVHGGMDIATQTAAKEAFVRHDETALDVLANDRILTEGFDAPEATVCFNLSPTLSRVRAQQRAGRVLRLDPARSNKHAYVIDFIDQSYRKNPVLFCDPRVAEEAQVGDMSNSIFANQDVQFSTDEARLVTDPESVTNKAQEFYESHKLERRLPPTDWLSIGQISALYGVDKSIVRNSLDGMSDGDPDLFGEFHSPENRTRTVKLYFHPILVRNFAYGRGLDFVDFEQTMPNGWIPRAHMEQDYPEKVMDSMTYFVKLLHGNAYPDNSVTHNGKEYFSPTLQKMLEKASRPTDMWRPVEQLCDDYYTDEVELEELCKIIGRRNGTIYETRPNWWLIDGRETMHIPSPVYGILKDELEEIRAREQTRELTDGDVVNLRQKVSDLDLLVRAFENEQRTQPGKGATFVLTAIQKAKLAPVELEAIYDLFS